MYLEKIVKKIQQAKVQSGSEVLTLLNFGKKFFRLRNYHVAIFCLNTIKDPQPPATQTEKLYYLGCCYFGLGNDSLPQC